MKVETKKKANKEQEAAIGHFGGKLLSAGAGSGKTFVLIEHIIFLLTDFKNKNDQKDWQLKIGPALGKIVLMTFTKKAAGEMSIRMMRRVDELLIEATALERSNELLFWKLIRQNLSLLNITTIHGFCHRLLRMGFWNQFPQNIELLSTIEHKDKIQKLFDQWFSETSHKLDPLFVSCSPALMTAMKDIFSSPELRVMWLNPHLPQKADAEIDLFFTQLIKVNGYFALFDNAIDLTVNNSEKNKKWHDLLVGFEEIRSQKGTVNSHNYLDYYSFFNTFSRFPTISKKEASEGQKEAFDLIRTFRDDLKAVMEDLKALTTHFNIYQKWVITISNLFNFINANYLSIDGFSFSDLEFYVHQGLNQSKILEKIQESFQYFIVDEFQDTSFIQFEILKKLIGDDHKKIFAVGDRKQAIYGFRGGELQVFSDCAQLLGSENNFFLKNNFRSYDAIINYNNSLFENIFPLGTKFEGHDPHGVSMESQNIPITFEQNRGEVICFKTTILGVESDYDLDALEAEVLVQHILEVFSKEEFQSICVLYRKLAPSSFLLEHMLKHDLAFSAQVKIKIADDPMMNLFLYLVELQLNVDDYAKSQSSKLLLSTLLEIFGLKRDVDLILEQFNHDIPILGLMTAFQKFVFSVGISNSMHSQNFSLIDSLCRIAKENLTTLYGMLKNDSSEDYSMEMMSGDSKSNSKKRITIMTAHASKGLEFDVVLLGGVHTNGRYLGMRDHLGKFPHSFKWKKSFNQKNYFKSPAYHLESEILKLKDFSESKRLLYVACTRAIKQLVYVDLYGMKKGEKQGMLDNANSWIQALRLYPGTIREVEVENKESLQIDIPLIQKDHLGILLHHNFPKLGHISELSVTRLASIANCNFKFYLQNICKIDNKSSSAIFQLIDSDEREEEKGYSSMARGTEIHQSLSKLFKNEIQRSDIADENQSAVWWAWDLANSLLANHEVISEKMIKFSLFGQMISGTPDVVFCDKLNNLVIWDFKTGNRNSENESSYWFQLHCYAFAYAKLKNIHLDQSIEISLLYVDQSEVVTQKLSLEEISQLLWLQWIKTESLNQVNLLHCPYCEYSNICHKANCAH